jgi:hypothetical protein
MVKGSYPMILLLDLLKTKDMLIESTSEATLIKAPSLSFVQNGCQSTGGAQDGSVHDREDIGEYVPIFSDLVEVKTRNGCERNSISPQTRMRMGSVDKYGGRDMPGTCLD